MRLHCRFAVSLVALAVLGLAGCQSVPQNEGSPTTVGKVVAQIKEDIGVYQAYDAANPRTPLNNKCKGNVGFRIDSVQVSLTTKTDNTLGGSGAVTLPIGPVTVGPTFSASRELIGTQNLTFSMYLKDETVPKMIAGTKIDAEKYPIAANLQRLREGLLEASNDVPCVSLAPIGVSEKGDPGGTFEFGFAVINSGGLDAKVTFVIFSLGASDTSKREASNTIRVVFKARAGSAAAIIF